MKCATLTSVMTRVGTFMNRFLQGSQIKNWKFVIRSYASGMSPMIIGKAPIRPLSDRRQTTGGGVHFMATLYPKGTRIEPHSHRESQLVFATEGTMQVTTPKGRWL